jgi:hypothetical protein
MTQGASGLARAAAASVGILNGVPLALLDERARACRDCEHGGKGWRCGICGCIIAAKIRDPQGRCPDEPPRWTEV